MPGIHLAADRRHARRSVLAGTAMLLVALATGCGAEAAQDAAPTVSQPSGSTVLRPASLRPGQPVPVPRAKPALTLTGAVSAVNRGPTVAFDRADLERIGLVQVRVYEPWAKKDLDFRGVWLQDLLRVAGARPDLGGVRITALDDYQVELSGAEVRAGGILVATGAGDGSALPVADGGPTRIIFVGGVPSGAKADQWIWSIKTIDVR